MLEPVWIWAIASLALLGLELVTGTFYILCFSIGAALVAMLTYLWPGAAIGLAGQLALYAILTGANLAVLHYRYKSNKNPLRIGQSNDESIGSIGHIVAAVSLNNVGTIRFAMPVMGAKTWMAVSDEELCIGQPAKVVSIEGNYLKVVSHKE